MLMCALYSFIDPRVIVPGSINIDIAHLSMKWLLNIVWHSKPALHIEMLNAFICCYKSQVLFEWRDIKHEYNVIVLYNQDGHCKNTLHWDYE